jgi:hypothetical protein
MLERIVGIGVGARMPLLGMRLQKSDGGFDVPLQKQSYTIHIIAWQS